MRLDELLEGVDVLERKGNAAVDVHSITHESGAVAPGALFCCVPGDHVDGHDFAGQAVTAGGGALLVDHPLAILKIAIRVLGACIHTGLVIKQI